MNHASGGWGVWNSSFRPLCYIVAVALVALNTTSHAGTIDDRIRQSLVYLEATGVAKVAGSSGTTSPQAAQLKSFGTGFIVSTDGLVLTTHDLISSLGDEVDPKTVRIQAHVADKSSPPESAIIVDAALSTDLLLLKLRPSAAPYVRVELGNPHTIGDDETIYTSGFPRAITHHHQNGRIQAKEAPAEEAYAWMTEFDFQDGLSGSPVYDASGKIIGVLKSISGANSTSIIPIGFADTLLAQVRLREIKQALGDFDALRYRFEWSLVEAGTRDAPQLNLVYKKLVPGDPKIAKIDVQVVPFGEGNQPGRVQLGPYVKEGLGPLTYDPDNSGGSFLLPQLVAAISEARERAGISNVTELRIAIIAVLPDGKKLPSIAIKAPYELDD